MKGLSFETSELLIQQLSVTQLKTGNFTFSTVFCEINYRVDLLAAWNRVLDMLMVRHIVKFPTLYGSQRASQLPHILSQINAVCAPTFSFFRHPY